ncbi:unnamed protein product [Discula destructiva]
MCQHFRSHAERSFWSDSEFKYAAEDEPGKLLKIEGWPAQRMGDQAPLVYAPKAILAHQAGSAADGSLVNILATRSVLVWNGQVSLEEFLAGLKMAWNEGEKAGHKWIPTWTLTRPPTCLRIEYTPKTTEAWSGHKTLAHLRATPPAIKPGPSGGSIEVEGGRVLFYNLVAVVRLADSRREPNYVRLYSDVSGQMQRPLEIQARSPSHDQDEWQLGELGHTYMLY